MLVGIFVSNKLIKVILNITLLKMKPTNFEMQLNRIEKILTERMDTPMNFAEACKYLNVTKSYLYKCTHKRLIPYYKPGGKKIFFSKKDLNEWIFKKRISLDSELGQIVTEKYSKSITKSG